MFKSFKQPKFINENVIYQEDTQPEPKPKDAEEDTEHDIISNLMTEYQFNDVVCTRTIQLSEGSFPYVSEFKDELGNIQKSTEYKVKSNIELRWIVLEELRQGVIPFRIPVHYPNGTTKYRRVCDMDLTAVMKLME